MTCNPTRTFPNHVINMVGIRSVCSRKCLRSSWLQDISSQGRRSHAGRGRDAFYKSAMGKKINLKPQESFDFEVFSSVFGPLVFRFTKG